MKTGKEYREFTDSGDVEDSGLNPVLSKEIEQLLMPMLKAEQLLGVDTELLAPKSGKKRTFRFRAKRHEVEDFLEDEDIPDVTPTDPKYSTIEVEPEYFGGREPITGEALDDADFNVLDDVRTSLAEGMAIKKDTRIWSVIMDVHEVIDEDPSFDGIETEFQFSVFATPPPVPATGVLEVDLTNVTMPAGTTYEVDYVQGWIKFSAAPTAGTYSYTYTTRTVTPATTTATLSYNDFVDARQSIISQYGKPNAIVIDTLGAGMLLKDDKFIDASHYGAATMMTGEIGKIAGMPVIGADNIPNYIGIVMEKGASFGRVVYKRKIFVTTEKIQKRPGDIWVIAWEKSKPAILRPFLVRIILNGAPNAYIHT